MNKKAMYKLSYGLYLLTCNKAGKDFGCVINTCIQVANDPNLISISVINKNHTAEILKETDTFNISVLSESAPFWLYQHFGMKSGRDVDKFQGYSNAARSGNGLLYLTVHANAYLSAEILDRKDLGSHTLIIARVTDGDVLNNTPSATYAYYQDQVKSKPAAPKPEDKKAWVCSVCGYIYEGEEVPEDFICPLCKHGKEDFVLRE
ncbi:MAG: flavin reductase [Lachnospiraceae bacterium]|nr:flavin reductase [Lachnospiraceae bacterium]